MQFIKSKEAMKEHRRLKNRWSLETSISQRVLISILDKLEQPKRDADKLVKRIKKLEEDLDHYIKNYPEVTKTTKEKICINCTGCALYRLRGKDESKDCSYFKYK